MAVLYHADARKRTGPAYVYFIPPVQSVRPLHLQNIGKACPLEDIIDLLRHMDHADRALHRLTEQKDDPEAGTRDIIQIRGIQDNRSSFFTSSALSESMRSQSLITSIPSLFTASMISITSLRTFPIQLLQFGFLYFQPAFSINICEPSFPTIVMLRSKIYHNNHTTF